uniref:Uncharacterized protein n=1 Tax=Cyanophora sudae TaxID=1522369 RepID=A0A2Z4HG67_9EUKA|nr:hypothetical protein [Cyanophora sudae]YP_009504484.1 hypothetical protein [Cyanophora sudae]AWW13642.1 hypothetical protein [Cyanophora sudae]AWW13643.1 hypothetical protein [Cyanophora sudae]
MTKEFLIKKIHKLLKEEKITVLDFIKFKNYIENNLIPFCYINEIPTNLVIDVVKLFLCYIKHIEVKKFDSMFQLLDWKLATVVYLNFVLQGLFPKIEPESDAYDPKNTYLCKPLIEFCIKKRGESCSLFLITLVSEIEKTEFPEALYDYCFIEKEYDIYMEELKEIQKIISTKLKLCFSSSYSIPGMYRHSERIYHLVDKIGESLLIGLEVSHQQVLNEWCLFKINYDKNKKSKQEN